MLQDMPYMCEALGLIPGQGMGGEYYKATPKCVLFTCDHLQKILSQKLENLKLCFPFQYIKLMVTLHMKLYPKVLPVFIELLLIFSALGGYLCINLHHNVIFPIVTTALGSGI